MNLSILSTYKQEKRAARKSTPDEISKILLELAEIHLSSPDTSHLISVEGVEKLRKKTDIIKKQKLFVHT